MITYWTHGYLKHDHGKELTYGSPQNSSPKEVLKHYKEMNKRVSFRMQPLIYAFVKYNSSKVTVRFFHTLAAANRFHKSLTAKQPA